MKQIMYTSLPQAEADRQASGVVSFLKLIGIAFIFMPLLVTGYMVSRMNIFITYSYLTRIVIIMAVAVLIFFFLRAIRGWIIQLRSNRNLLWIPVALCCLAYTCLFTPWMLHDGVSTLFARWHWSPLMEIVLDAVIVTITYIPYDFLGILGKE